MRGGGLSLHDTLRKATLHAAPADPLIRFRGDSHLNLMFSRPSFLGPACCGAWEERGAPEEHRKIAAFRKGGS